MTPQPRTGAEWMRAVERRMRSVERRGPVQPNSIRVDPPKTFDAPGTPGWWAVDADYVYFCITPNNWARAALSTW